MEDGRRILYVDVDVSGGQVQRMEGRRASDGGLTGRFFWPDRLRLEMAQSLGKWSLIEVAVSGRETLKSGAPSRSARQGVAWGASMFNQLPDWVHQAINMVSLTE